MKTIEQTGIRQAFLLFLVANQKGHPLNVDFVLKILEFLVPRFESKHSALQIAWSVKQKIEARENFGVFKAAKPAALLSEDQEEPGLSP